MLLRPELILGLYFWISVGSAIPFPEALKNLDQGQKQTSHRAEEENSFNNSSPPRRSQINFRTTSVDDFKENTHQIDNSYTNPYSSEFLAEDSKVPVSNFEKFSNSSKSEEDPRELKQNKNSRETERLKNVHDLKQIKDSLKREIEDSVNLNHSKSSLNLNEAKKGVDKTKLNFRGKSSFQNWLPTVCSQLFRELRERSSSTFASTKKIQTLNENMFPSPQKAVGVKGSNIFVGEDVTLCWIETITIKENKSSQPPKKVVLKEFTVSFENSAAIPEKYLECAREEELESKLEEEMNLKLKKVDPELEEKLDSKMREGSDSETEKNSNKVERSNSGRKEKLGLGSRKFKRCQNKTKSFAIEEDSRFSKVVNFTIIETKGHIEIRQYKNIRCAVGPVVTGTVIDFKDGSKHSKKRVEIKISPKVKEKINYISSRKLKKTEKIRKSIPREKFEDEAIEIGFEDGDEEQDEEQAIIERTDSKTSGKENHQRPYDESDLDASEKKVDNSENNFIKKDDDKSFSDSFEHEIRQRPHDKLYSDSSEEENHQREDDKSDIDATVKKAQQKEVNAENNSSEKNHQKEDDKLNSDSFEHESPNRPHDKSDLDSSEEKNMEPKSSENNIQNEIDSSKSDLFETKEDSKQNKSDSSEQESPKEEDGGTNKKSSEENILRKSYKKRKGSLSSSKEDLSKVIGDRKLGQRAMAALSSIDEETNEPFGRDLISSLKKRKSPVDDENSEDSENGLKLPIEYDVDTKHVDTKHSFKHGSKQATQHGIRKSVKNVDHEIEQPLAFQTKIPIDYGTKQQPKEYSENSKKLSNENEGDSSIFSEDTTNSNESVESECDSSESQDCLQLSETEELRSYKELANANREAVTQSTTDKSGVASINSTGNFNSGLRVRILLEHIDKNEEKRKLTSLDTQLPLKEKSKEVLDQMKALNDSVYAQTIMKSLMNCTTLKKLAKEGISIEVSETPLALGENVGRKEVELAGETSLRLRRKREAGSDNIDNDAKSAVAINPVGRDETTNEVGSTVSGHISDSFTLGV